MFVLLFLVPIFALLEQVHVAFSEFDGRLSVSLVSDQDPAEVNAAPRLFIAGHAIDHEVVFSGYKRWFYHFLTPMLHPGNYDYHFEGQNSSIHQLTYPDEAKAHDSFSFM